MSPRARIYTLVGVIAAAAARPSSWRSPRSRADHPPGPRPGKPAVRGRLDGAGGALRRGPRAAVGDGARGSASLASRSPRSSFVRLNLGLALFWRRDDAAASRRGGRRSALAAGHAVGRARRRPAPPGLAARACRSSSRAFARADDGRAAAARPRRAAPAERPARLGRAAVRAPRPRSRPGDPDAQVAAAVGLYDKDRSGRARSAGSGRSCAVFRKRRRFASISGYSRSGSARSARPRRELRLAVAEDPRNRLGKGSADCC